MQDTRTPLYTSLVAIFFNVGLSFLLSSRYGVVGLAMAQSIVAGIEVTALIIILKLRLGRIGGREIWRGLSRMLIAGAIMAGTTYILVGGFLPLYKADLGFAIVGPKFLTIFAASTLAYMIPCYLLDLREAHQFARKAKEQALRPLNLT
jgi:peptidoglycan biosynthesis protein MviN/MurJ (putative lipid II flippase)